MKITTSTLPAGVVGSYCQDLKATGGKEPYRWSLTQGSLPAGLDVDATGKIVGQASVIGTFNFLLTASDSETPAASDSAPLSIVISPQGWQLKVVDFLGLCSSLWKLLFLAIAFSIIGGIVWQLIPDGYAGTSSFAQIASFGWGAVGFILLLLIFVLAAKSPQHFLALFCTGGFGAACGYLIAVWITATGAEGEQIGKVQQIIAGALSGVVGTKLLTLWDDLTKGDDPKILKLSTYSMLIAGLVGFTLSLAAFYTVKSIDAHAVNLTVESGKLFSYKSGDTTYKNGVRIPIDPSPISTLQFAGASSSPDDMSVSWAIRPRVSYANLSDFHPSIDPNGKLTIPHNTEFKAVADKFNGKKLPDDALEWEVVATSNQDRSKSSSMRIRFCVTDSDCVPVAPSVPSPPKAPSEEKPKNK